MSSFGEDAPILKWPVFWPEVMPADRLGEEPLGPAAHAAADRLSGLWLRWGLELPLLCGLFIEIQVTTWSRCYFLDTYSKNKFYSKEYFGWMLMQRQSKSSKCINIINLSYIILLLQGTYVICHYKWLLKLLNGKIFKQMPKSGTIYNSQTTNLNIP